MMWNLIINTFTTKRFLVKIIVFNNVSISFKRKVLMKDTKETKLQRNLFWMSKEENLFSLNLKMSKTYQGKNSDMWLRTQSRDQQHLEDLKIV